MIFLIEYARDKGRIVSLRTFEETDRRTAQEARLELELGLHRSGVNHEVVLLQAENEAALRRTHQRYFDDLRHIAEDLRALVEAEDRSGNRR